MRIVLLNQFYPPDVAPTGRYLHDLARVLVARGHEVTAIASRHAYGGGGEFEAREVLDGVQVLRLGGSGFGRSSYLGKLADYTAYYAALARELARVTRPELVISLTTPPFLGLLAKLIADLRKAAHAHWVMDVYPDALQAHGVLPPGMPYKALQAIARQSFSGAQVVLTLGPRMAERLEPYVGESTRIDWIPLWAPQGLAPSEAGEARALREQRGWEPDRLVLLYSGNLGLGHRFEEFLSAAERLGESGPRWVFTGGGKGRPTVDRFVAEHPGLPIQLLPHVADADLARHLGSADVHLVSVEPAWDGLILPSKFQGSFAVGRPVIFVGNSSNEVARWLRESGGGYAFEAGDVDGLVSTLRTLTQGELAERGRAASCFAERNFSLANAERVADCLVGR